MAMKTHIRRDGNVVVVSLQGQLDYETTDLLRDNLFKLQKESKNDQVVFDLGDLQFVGSSGISAFVQTLRDFNVSTNNRPRYANVRNEFKRIMTAFDDSGTFEFWETTERALRSIDN